MITTGTCADVNMNSIIDIDTCELAARALGLQDTTANITLHRDRPEGCYLLTGNRLWLSIGSMNARLFSPGEYKEQNGTAIPPNGNLHLYSVGSSNLVWMNWIDQLHFYLSRLGYRLPLIPTQTILSRDVPRSCPICDDTAYFAQLRTARLGMVGWNSWDFSYNSFNDCSKGKDSSRNVSGHQVKC